MATDPLAPIEPLTPQGDVVALGIPDTQDYPRLVFAAPYHTTVAIADLIEPSVLEAVQGMLPTLVPPYVNAAANAAVNALAVLLTGSTMTGPLYLNGLPTQPTQAADKQYVDTMVATGNVPEVPPVPNGQTWARQTGQWVPLAGGGSVSNITTGAGLTGGPITTTGMISMSNMNGNTLKGNNTATVTAPTDLNVGQVMTMLGAAPLNSPNFAGTPTLPTGTQAITQPGGTNNTSVATTAFVAASSALALPLAGGTMTGAIVLAGNAAANLNPVPLQQLTSSLGAYVPLGGGTMTGALVLSGNATANLNPVALQQLNSAIAGYLPITGGTLTGSLQVNTGGTQRFLVNTGVVIGNSAPDPGVGGLVLNQNAAAPLAPWSTGTGLQLSGPDGVPAVIELDAFGANFSPTITLRQARGTGAAPAASQQFDNLAVMNFLGRDTAAFGIGAQIVGQATQTWAAGAHGTGLYFQTVPNGSTAVTVALSLTGNTATFPGPINANGGINQIGASGQAFAIGLFGGLPTINFAASNYLQLQSAGTLVLAASASLTITTPTFTINAGIYPNADNVRSNGIPGTAWFQVCSYNFPNSSDPRLKSDMQRAAPGGLGIVEAIDVHEFTYTTDPTEHRHIGFDASQVRDLHPHAYCEGDDDAKTMAVNLPDMIAVLWQAVQELSAEVRLLKGENP